VPPLALHALHHLRLVTQSSIAPPRAASPTRAAALALATLGHAQPAQTAARPRDRTEADRTRRARADRRSPGCRARTVRRDGAGPPGPGLPPRARRDDGRRRRRHGEPTRARDANVVTPRRGRRRGSCDARSASRSGVYFEIPQRGSARDMLERAPLRGTQTPAGGMHGTTLAAAG
jgi:hypothetical protein